MMGTRGDDFLGDPSRNNRISDQFIMDVTQMAAVAAAASAAPSSPSIRSLHRQDIRMSDQFLLFPGVKSSSVIMENTPFAAGRESMLSMESQTSVSTDVDMDSHVQAADSRMHSGDGTGNSNAATAATALDTAFKGDASGSSSSSSTPTTAAGAIASVDGNFVNHANSTQSLSQNISIPPLVGDVDASNMSFLAAQPGGGWPLQADLLSFALPPSDLSSHLGRGDASAPGGTNGTMFYSLPRNQVFQHLPKEDSGQFAVPPRSSASLPRPASKISSDESGGGFSFGDFFPTSSTHPRSGSAAAVAADFTSWQLGTAGLAANTASPFLVSNNVADAVPQPSPLAQPVLDQMVPSPAPFAPQTMDLQQTAALVAQLLPTDTFGLTQSISASPFLAPGRGNQDLTHSPLGSAAPILPLQITTNLMDNGQLEMPISEFDFQSLTSSAGMPDQMISTTEMATTGTQSSSSGTLLPTSRRPSVSAAHVTPAVAPSPQLVSLTSPVLTPTPTPSSATLERFPALAAKAAAAIDSSIKSSGLPVTAAFHKYFPQGHQMVQSNPPGEFRGTAMGVRVLRSLLSSEQRLQMSS
ncbi:hypothetical protein DFJ73DRAFT_530098 [Zopfochytrium polystomum]|nr:hypothetical protein DFJ73DRAFT_530098 [Zopfochytrium polystomum]